jgi:uncharacterized protein (DUF779 family)
MVLVEAKGKQMFTITTQHGTTWKTGYATRYAAEQAAKTNRNPHVRLTVQPSGTCCDCGSPCHAHDDYCIGCESMNEAHDMDDAMAIGY